MTGFIQQIFTESEEFGAIYFYSYALVVISIVFGAAYFVSKIKLFQETYMVLTKIEKHLGKATIAINGLSKKYRLVSKRQNENWNYFEKWEKVKNIDGDTVKACIKRVFTEIRYLIDKHETYLISKVEKMEQENLFQLKKMKTMEILMTTNETEEKVERNEHTDDNNYNDDRESQGKLEEATIEYKEDIVDKSPQEKLNKLERYVEKEYLKHVVSGKKKFGAFIDILWKIRGLLVPALAHFFDTATDIALIWEWYLLSQTSALNDYDIDIYSLFISSLCVVIYYRISSTFEVWQFSHDKYDALLQLLFDFFLIKLIYVNIFKMKQYQASQIIKQFRMIEGGNEAAFQSILTLVFLIKTQFNSTTVAFVSLAASLFSLMSRLAVLDKGTLIVEARRLDTIEFGDLSQPRVFCHKLFGRHWSWIVYRMFRMTEVLFTVVLIAVFWCVVGGRWVPILGIIALINIYNQYKNSGYVQTDWFNYILVVNMAEIADTFHYYCAGGRRASLTRVTPKVIYTWAVRFRLLIMRSVIIIIVILMIAVVIYQQR